MGSSRNPHKPDGDGLVGGSSRVPGCCLEAPPFTCATVAGLEIVPQGRKHAPDWADGGRETERERMGWLAMGMWKTGALPAGSGHGGFVKLAPQDRRELVSRDCWVQASLVICRDSLWIKVSGQGRESEMPPTEQTSWRLRAACVRPLAVPSGRRKRWQRFGVAEMITTVEDYSRG